MPPPTGSEALQGPPDTLDGDRSAVQSRRISSPITFPEQNQKRLDGYVLYSTRVERILQNVEQFSLLPSPNPGPAKAPFWE